MKRGCRRSIALTDLVQRSTLIGSGREKKYRKHMAYGFRGFRGDRGGAMESFFWECISFLRTMVTNFRNLERDMKGLRAKTDELSAQEEDVMTKVEREEVEKGKKRKREVDVWLENVKRFKKEVDGAEENVRESRGWISGYKLTKHIEDLKAEGVQLKEKNGFPDGVAIHQLGIPSPQPAATLHSESANATMKRIWNHLLDVEIRKVGVYGMAGVGKTTILKHIHNQLLDSGVFKSILWVTVSKALDLYRLQEEIASAIGLDLPNRVDNEESRSSKIHAELSRRERCLLILDDVWKPFSLDRIGIPEPNQTNGFKLAITTRSITVCRGMESERIVKVEVLLPEEAWDLFEEKVGGPVLDSSEIKPIAELIVKECDCLPLAIITVGRALRGARDVSVWRNALNELKCSYTEIDGMDDCVFSRLMFSYNRLRNDRIKDCFLYCALYPEDYKIHTEQLIENWVGEGWIYEMENTERERDKGYTILRELIDSCMIKGYDSVNLAGRLDTIELHDLIRDLAINITRVSPRFMVKAREYSEETPRVEEWVENMKRVSLMDNKIKILSGQPMCPQLTTLFLQGNNRLTEISNSFFENMQGLRVVDLSETWINSLPESFFALKNLRVLRLDYCDNLHKVPCLATLKHLRVLSLDRTLIQELPQGIEELVNLRKLCLNRTRRLNFFPAGIIPKLTLLEELEMFGSGWRWPSNTVRAAADIKEIVESTKITCLRLCFEDVNGFNNLVGSGKVSALKSFYIALGKIDRFALGERYLFCNLGCSKIVAVEGTGVAGGSHASNLLLPRNVQGMKIKEVDNVTSLSQFSQPPNEAWANLEVLCLFRLPNLRAIFDGVGSIGAYVHLKRLVVGGCNQMKSLFSLEQLKNLQNLEKLEIWDCALMEDVVADDANALTTISSLPKLGYVSILRLPELKSIFKTMVTCYSLYSIKVSRCPKLKKLPFTTRNISLPTLERIYGDREWWDALEWDDPDVKVQLQDRFTVF
ncbi:putative disease resistance protein isoform X1 [Cinnamomum micranthum f. kanehirae]|uniref:Putative disease resistance protein isoform X1 n=1 Tax=Cinnamomum micranthum f. kanehirae TaxID=337451 RepID=A0A443PLC3_9MAGN|nr:putative disease resistance protein isoform X1 [Cinnamomum micranthum f. kanehirae]